MQQHLITFPGEEVLKLYANFMIYLHVRNDKIRSGKKRCIRIFFFEEKKIETQIMVKSFVQSHVTKFGAIPMYQCSTAAITNYNTLSGIKKYNLLS